MRFTRRHAKHIARFQPLFRFSFTKENDLPGSYVRDLLMNMLMIRIRFIPRSVREIDHHRHQVLRMDQFSLNTFSYYRGLYFV
jgi:hypothetical protein